MISKNYKKVAEISTKQTFKNIYTGSSAQVLEVNTNFTFIPKRIITEVSFTAERSGRLFSKEKIVVDSRIHWDEWKSKLEVTFNYDGYLEDIEFSITNKRKEAFSLIVKSWDVTIDVIVHNVLAIE